MNSSYYIRCRKEGGFELKKKAVNSLIIRAGRKRKGKPKRDSRRSDEKVLRDTAEVDSC